MAESTSYRPLSGLAIAGFGLAVLYALGMTVLAVVALATGVPMLLDQMAIVWPVGAFAVSAAGWLQINRSEGTRAGLALARWGMLLSAVVGLCYLSWRVAKEQAVKAEAQSFADDWLARLRVFSSHDVDRYVAFWETLDPDRRDPRFPLTDPRFQEQLRQSASAVNELKEYVNVRYVFGGGDQGSRYQRFLDHELIQLMSQRGNEEFKTEGIRSWTYLGTAQGGYQVDLNYRITTVEGSFPAVISVLSSEDPKGAGRQWQVLLEGTSLAPPAERQLSPAGKEIMALRLDSREFARDWARKLSQGLREEAFLDTRPPESRRALRALIQTGPPVTAVAVAALGPAGLLCRLQPLTDAEAARLLHLPDFAGFTAGALVNDDTLQADPSIKPGLAANMKVMYRPWPKGTVPSLVVADDGTHLTSRCQLQGDGHAEVVFFQPFGIRFPSNHTCAGVIRVVLTDSNVLKALNTPAPSPVSLPIGQRGLRWRIAGIDLLVGSALAPKDGQR
jgi:hypothetical protein